MNLRVEAKTLKGWFLGGCWQTARGWVKGKKLKETSVKEKLLSFKNKHFDDMPPHPYHFMDGCGAILYERHTSERRKEALNPKP